MFHVKQFYERIRTMVKRSKKTNVISQLHQQVLSGWSGFGKPENWNGASDEAKQGREERTPKGFWQSKTYMLSIPVIIEQVSLSGDEHKYTISLNDNAHLSLSTYSKRGKKLSKETVAIHPTKGRSFSPIHLVYGIHESGELSLPHIDQQEMGRVVAQIYSQILGKVDAAIQRTLLERAQQTPNDDAGKRSESSSTPQDVGEPKKRRGGKKVRTEVLPETLPEIAAQMVEADRSVLGERPKDVSGKLVGMGNITHLGEEP